MGRRSRKRQNEVGESDSPKPAGERPRAKSSSVELKPQPPQAPWGSFPLVEIAVLLALIIGVVGFIVGGRQGMLLVFIALGLGSLAGLELSIREHFAGFRSHTSLLAALPAAIALGVCFVLQVPYVLMLAIAVVIFSVGFWLLRDLFRRRSGGQSFR